MLYLLVLQWFKWWLGLFQQALLIKYLRNLTVAPFAALHDGKLLSLSGKGFDDQRRQKNNSSERDWHQLVSPACLGDGLLFPHLVQKAV